MKALDYKTEKVRKSCEDRQRIVLITNMADIDLINGIESAIKEKGYSLLVITVGIEIQTMAEVYDQLICLKQFVSGVLIYGLFCDEKIIKTIKKDFAVVVLGDNEMCGTYIVGIDNIAASREMVNGIIKRGCKRIALITGDQKNARVRTFSYEREIGYMKALLEGGIKYDPGIVMTGAITEDAGYELTKKLLDKNCGIDAIFCISDAIALGCLQALHERNIAVPKDIAVCGFDNTRASKWSIPRLTTIEQNLNESGARAAQLLCSLIHGGDYENCKIYVKNRITENLCNPIFYCAYLNMNDARAQRSFDPTLISYEYI